MRKIRILLLLVAAGAIAAVVTPTASALGFEDEPCPPQPQLKVCHPDAEVGKPYTLAIQGKGGCTPDSVVYDIVAGTLPPGLSVSSSNASVSGVPTRAGIYQFWLQVSDIPQWKGGAFWCQDDKQSQWQFQITVVEGLQIQQRQSTLTPGQVSVPYSLQLTATGGTPTWAVSSGSLPAGLNLNSSSGLLSGTPTTAGDYNFKITATAGTRTDTQTYRVSVVEPLRIARPAAPPAAEVGLPFQLELKATGGKAPYKWTATGLPSGFTLDAATGVITGTPAAESTTPVKVTVTDALGLTNTLDVNLPVAAKLALKRAALPAATVGAPYSARLVTTGGVGPYTWTVLGAGSRRVAGVKRAGALPPGIKLNPRTGRLTGTPRKAGTYRFRVQVTDKLGASATLGFVIKVSGGARHR